MKTIYVIFNEKEVAYVTESGFSVDKTNAKMFETYEQVVAYCYPIDPKEEFLTIQSIS